MEHNAPARADDCRCRHDGCAERGRVCPCPSRRPLRGASCNRRACRRSRRPRGCPRPSRCSSAAEFLSSRSDGRHCTPAPELAPHVVPASGVRVSPTRFGRAWSRQEPARHPRHARLRHRPPTAATVASRPRLDPLHGRAADRQDLAAARSRRCRLHLQRHLLERPSARAAHARELDERQHAPARARLRWTRSPAPPVMAPGSGPRRSRPPSQSDDRGAGASRSSPRRLHDTAMIATGSGDLAARRRARAIARSGRGRVGSSSYPKEARCGRG